MLDDGTGWITVIQWINDASGVSKMNLGDTIEIRGKLQFIQHTSNFSQQDLESIGYLRSSLTYLRYILIAKEKSY